MRLENPHLQRCGTGVTQVTAVETTTGMHAQDAHCTSCSQGPFSHVLPHLVQRYKITARVAHHVARQHATFVMPHSNAALAYKDKSRAIARRPEKSSHCALRKHHCTHTAARTPHTTHHTPPSPAHPTPHPQKKHTQSHAASTPHFSDLPQSCQAAQRRRDAARELVVVQVQVPAGHTSRHTMAPDAAAEPSHSPTTHISSSHVINKSYHMQSYRTKLHPVTLA
jgi:hypothetical protein